MPGPKKVPLHLKLIKGTVCARDRRPSPNAQITPGLPPINAIPAPPAWMQNKAALAEWGRLAPVLVANRLLTDGNLGLLAQLCAVHGNLVGIWKSGMKANAALVASYRALSNSLGLLDWNVSGVKAGHNRFAKNAARIKGRP